MHENSGLPEATTADVWTFGDVEFDEPQWQLRVRGVPVDVEVRPLEVLRCLLRHAGEVVTKEELFQAAWPGLVVVEAAQTQAVAKLRKALGELGAARIVTVHRVGYRFDGGAKRIRVKRTPQPKLDLKPGEQVPRREHWRLLELLNVNPGSEVWRVQHAKTREDRCLKFATDPRQLSALKREVTLSRVLTMTLGQRADIVRVLDWSFDEPPFFIECEYGGQDLRMWAQRPDGLAVTPLDQRLELFIGIADAVAAAHSAGVLHKDLKPANVLVAVSRDGRVQPRLTDFGSARLLDSDVLSALSVTEMGFTQTSLTDSNSGTLFYLAPELLEGQPPTIQADVYALGVLLYQIVTGDLRRPLAAGWESEISEELLREDIAAAADGNPQRRLASVQELAERVRSLARRRAELATRRASESRTEAMTRELARARARRPWITATTLALVIGIGCTTVLYLRAHAAQQEAARNAADTETVLSFLTNDILAAASPRRSGAAGGMKMRDVIDRASRTFHRRLGQRPAVEGALRETLGTVYIDYAEHAKGVEQLTEAVRLLTAAHGPAHPRTVRAMYNLANALMMDSKLADASRILDEADALRVEIDDAHLHMRADFVRALHHYLLGEREQAAVLQARAIEARSALEGPDHPEVAVQRSALVTLYLDLGRVADAEAALQPALARLGGLELISLKAAIDIRRAHGALLAAQKRRSEAIPVLLEALRLARINYGAESPVPAWIMNDAATAYAHAREWTQAIAYQREAYGDIHRLHGADHVNTVIFAGVLGIFLFEGGRSAEATALLEAGRSGYAKLYGSEHAAVQQMEFYLASTYRALGRNVACAALTPRLRADILAHAEPRDDWPARLESLRNCERRATASSASGSSAST